MSFRPFALQPPVSGSQVMLSTSSSPTSSGGSPGPGGLGSPVGAGGPPPGQAPAHKACREAGRALLTDPATGHTVCSCEYPAPGLLGYPRLPPSLLGIADPALYNQAAAFAAQAQAGYLGLPSDPASAIYSMGAPFELKESPDGLRTLAQTSPFYYDPGLAYPYSYNGLELSSAARRKNATRENTNTLKAWLYEHRKNPYPTKGEKIMLAIITKMTLTQVSTWFANARRRLKKENKMTWSPRSGGRDDDDDDDDHDDDATTDKTEKRDSKDLGSTGEDDDKDDDDDEDIVIDEGFEESCLASSRLQASLAAEALRRAACPTTQTREERRTPSPRHTPSSSRHTSPVRPSTPSQCSPSPHSPGPLSPGQHSPSHSSMEDSQKTDPHVKSHEATQPQTLVIASRCSTEQSPNRPKPRIWSIADVATSASPPPARRSPGARPAVRGPWAVTATYALSQHQALTQQALAGAHPYFMLPRPPMGHHLPYTISSLPPQPKSSPSGVLVRPEERQTPPNRVPLQNSPHRSHGGLQNPGHRSPADQSPVHRGHAELQKSPHDPETAFKIVPKRIPTL